MDQAQSAPLPACPRSGRMRRRRDPAYRRPSDPRHRGRQPVRLPHLPAGDGKHVPSDVLSSCQPDAEILHLRELIGVLDSPVFPADEPHAPDPRRRWRALQHCSLLCLHAAGHGCHAFMNRATPPPANPQRDRELAAQPHYGPRRAVPLSPMVGELMKSEEIQRLRRFQRVNGALAKALPSAQLAKITPVQLKGGVLTIDVAMASCWRNCASTMRTICSPSWLPPAPGSAACTCGWPRPNRLTRKR
jgi:hypothetical protein